MKEFCLFSSNSQDEFSELQLKMEAYWIRSFTGTSFWWIIPESIRSKTLIVHFWRRGFYILRHFSPNVGLIKPEKAHFSAGLELLDEDKQCCSFMRLHYNVGKIPVLAGHLANWGLQNIWFPQHYSWNGKECNAVSGGRFSADCQNPLYFIRMPKPIALLFMFTVFCKANASEVVEISYFLKLVTAVNTIKT